MKTLKKTSFLRKKKSFNVTKLLWKSDFFQESGVYSYIYISTLSSNYNQM